MAKQRKTRKEKIRQDRRLLTPSDTTSPSQPNSQLFSFNSTLQASSKPQSVSTAEYSYLTRDLLKTTILVFSIFVVEIILALVIKV